ncbi:hypothetical protein [Sphingopyxis sp.]|uniref:hypothetical protein n=1 Tax=Sphingopyxis sp. TaxID=1908224 RepID=UPI0025DBEF8B|nr:hypothetical protein [Sphingopyxis sp.]MBR2172704.1 hypothetical protein [Sphingopyxis sp.]
MTPGTAHSGAAQPIWTPAFAGAHPSSREPYGGRVSCEAFEPEKVQTCLSIGRLIHDDDCIKILAGSATIVGDEERLMPSGVIEIPACCVVRIVRLEEKMAD